MKMTLPVIPSFKGMCESEMERLVEKLIDKADKVFLSSKDITQDDYDNWTNELNKETKKNSRL